MTKSQKPIKVNSRNQILSHFVYQIGGWNATPGIHTGRLVSVPDFNNDEKIVRLLLDRHKRDVAHGLEEEIKRLKAEIYDLHNEREAKTRGSTEGKFTLHVVSAGQRGVGIPSGHDTVTVVVSDASIFGEPGPCMKQLEMRVMEVLETDFLDAGFQTVLTREKLDRLNEQERKATDHENQ